MNITEEQASSLQNLLDRYQDLPEDIILHGPILDYALQVNFPYIAILIETDGYTHS